MRRGEIFYAELDPTKGSETGKRRPVLIISNDANNQAGNTVTVLPITSNVSRIYPFEVLLEIEVSELSKQSKIQAQQIRTIAKERLTGKSLGVLSTELMKKVELPKKPKRSAHSCCSSTPLSRASKTKSDASGFTSSHG